MAFLLYKDCGSKIVFNKDWAMLLPKLLLSTKQKNIGVFTATQHTFFGRPAHCTEEMTSKII